MPEYIIQLGETLDTTEKVMKATPQLLAKLVPHADDDTIRQAIRELETDEWAVSPTGQPLPGDVNAIRALANQILDRERPALNQRQAETERSSRQGQPHLKKDDAFLSIEEAAEFFALLDEVDDLKPGVNRTAFLEYMRTSAAKIKRLQRRLGLRPCSTDDCIRFVEGRRNKKYCSTPCRLRHQKILKRRRGPDSRGSV